LQDAHQKVAEERNKYTLFYMESQSKLIEMSKLNEKLQNELSRLRMEIQVSAQTKSPDSEYQPEVTCKPVSWTLNLQGWKTAFFVMVATVFLLGSLSFLTSESFAHPLKHHLKVYQHDHSYIHSNSSQCNVQSGTYGMDKRSYQWADGSMYHGDWRDGKMNGDGLMKFADGNVYDGEWLNGLQHGQGTFYWKSGSIFAGEWKNDMMDGYGVWMGNDGREYEGQWKQDRKHGVGSFKWYEGNLLQGSYEGEWRDDAMHGYGIYTFTDGSTLEGHWMHGAYQGLTS
jgi:hypothetical protein